MTRSILWTLAAALSTVLAAMGIALVWAERRLRGAHARHGSSVTSRAPRTPVALGRCRGLALLALAAASALVVTYRCALARDEALLAAELAALEPPPHQP